MTTCAAVSPWGDACVREAGHVGDHQTAVQRAEALARWTAERDAFWAAAARRAEAARRGKIKEVLTPIVLVPTPAQRAAGQRIVDARDDQVPAAARLLAKRAIAGGWAVRVTYAHALMPPKRGSEDWWDNHSVAVRLGHPDGRRAWGCWSNGGWDGGQWWTPGTMVRNVGARELATLVAPAVSDASLDSQARQLVGSAA